MSETDMPREYKVTYQTKDGYHLFTSEDHPGMYIATKDAAKALSDIPKVIEYFEKEKRNADLLG